MMIQSVEEAMTLASTPAQYAIISGQGRSGTNFLLKLLDQSPLTFARNEPNLLAGSLLHDLPDGLVIGENDAQLEQRWDAAVRQAAFSMGERDHRANVSKTFLRPISQHLGLYRIVHGPRFRRVLRTVMPSLNGTSWPIPRWIAHYPKLEQALPVLKVNGVPGWIVWTLTHRPQGKVMHIVRHPGGFLNSWRNRWLLINDQREVHQRNLDRLKHIASMFSQWASRFGDIDAMSHEEAELWFWCYTNEAINEAGCDLPHYQLVIYEQLCSHPVEVARRLYDFCGLPWTGEIEKTIRAETRESPTISSSWQEKLTPKQVGIVNRILADSPTQTWWQ